MEKCIQIIRTNTKEVLNDSSFEDVDINTVITVFSLDQLKVDNELDLFKAAERYAKAHDNLTTDRRSALPTVNTPERPEPSTCKEQALNVEGNAENSPEATVGPRENSDNAGEVARSQHPQPDDRITKTETKAKPTIRSAIEKIRFLTLTPQQFAEGPARSSLLTESETFAVLMNIASSTSDVPMPAGFSTCRVQRKRLIGGSNHDVLTHTPSPARSNRICSRFITNTGGYYNNTGTLECSVTFRVDKDIRLLGVQVLTQRANPRTGSAVGKSRTYQENLEACVVDENGLHLSRTPITGVAQYQRDLDIMFNLPVNIQRSKTYKLSIKFFVPGQYPMGTFRPQAVNAGVHFNFLQVGGRDCKDDLIRSLIYSDIIY